MKLNVARNLFTRLIQNTEQTDSGPVSLSADDAKSLRDVAAEIVRRENEGDRERWGPRVSEMNALCKVVLTNEQLQKKGLRFAIRVFGYLIIMTDKESFNYVDI